MLRVSSLPCGVNALESRSPAVAADVSSAVSPVWTQTHCVRRVNLLTDRIDYITEGYARSRLSGIVSAILLRQCRGSTSLFSYRKVEADGKPPRIWPGEGDQYRIPAGTEIRCMACLAGKRDTGVLLPFGPYICVRHAHDTFDRLQVVLCPVDQDPESYDSDFYYPLSAEVAAFKVD